MVHSEVTDYHDIAIYYFFLQLTPFTLIFLFGHMQFRNLKTIYISLAII